MHPRLDAKDDRLLCSMRLAGIEPLQSIFHAFPMIRRERSELGAGLVPGCRHSFRQIIRDAKVDVGAVGLEETLAEALEACFAEVEDPLDNTHGRPSSLPVGQGQMYFAEPRLSPFSSRP